MSSRITSEFPVTIASVQNNKIITEKTTKEVISEISLKIILNSEDFVSLLCINQLAEELAIGFLFTEAIIDSANDIESINFNDKLMAVVIETIKKDILPKESVRSVTTGCGKGLTYLNPLKVDKFDKIENNQQITLTKIWEIMQNFNKQSELYKIYGGVHSVLFYHDSFTLFNEDIGRHNCLDKIAGLLLKENKLDKAAEGLIVTSGRISTEILLKCLRLKIPIVVSRSAPTASAIELAQKFNITLLGYVRGNKANIYTGGQQILFK